MGKRNQLERAIENLKQKRDVLDLAIAQLEAQIAKPKPAPKAKPRLVGEMA